MNMPFDFTSTNVLVIDDETFMRQFIRRIFEKNGVGKISEASDGADGLSVVIRSEHRTC